jgi:hypothetical protein
VKADYETVLDMNARASLRPCVILLSLAGCGGDFELPPLAASSKYINYHTDADASVICMDDLLAREDRFIERTAAMLGVNVPSSPIDFVWDPIQSGADPWACPQNAASTITSCYLSREKDDLAVVISRDVANHHELVHAVDVAALGADGHPTLGEGLAEYLGALKSTLHPQGFPEVFKAMVAKIPIPNSYRWAMHFVGSIFARHGAEKYRALRAEMPKNAGLETFAEAFEAVYGQSLDDALVEMNGESVYGIDKFPACDDGEVRELPWTGEGLIDAMIESSCGDPWFFGGGFVDGQAGFYGYYVIEVPEAGYYDLTVGGGPLLGLMTGCSFAMLESAVGSFSGQTGRRLLQPGRHTLAIAFPPGPEARGEATVRLEYVAPPP